MIPIDELQQIIATIENNLQSGSVPIRVKTGDVYPSEIAAAIRWDNNQMRSEAMVWGYPKYQGSGVIFNTRAETADNKVMWRDSLHFRRCLVPSAGFYEWKNSKGSEKQRYLFNLPDTRILFMAGIYKKIQKTGDPGINHFSILTTQPNQSIKDVHNRMPVVLRPEEYQQWLTGDYHALFDRSNVLLQRSAF